MLILPTVDCGSTLARALSCDHPRLGRHSNLAPPLSREAHSTSIAPLLSPNRQAIEDLAIELPLGHESVHKRNEVGVVGRL